MLSAADGRLRLDIAGPVARLLLDRPDRRNAMDQAMWQALPALVSAAEADDAVRVLLLMSATPGIFCAGADISEFAAHAGDPAWCGANQQAIRGTQLALARCAKPVIAVIDGDAVGGGCGLALAADMRLASRRARFGVTPAKLGIIYPLHDTRLLVDLVGPAQAKRLLFSAALIDAAEAIRIGLADEVHDDENALAGAVDRLARQIAANAPSSVQAMKAVVQRIVEGVQDDDDVSTAQFNAAFTGADFAEGVAAFLAKRPPRF